MTTKNKVLFKLINIVKVMPRINFWLRWSVVTLTALTIVFLLFLARNETKQRLDIGYGITTNSNIARLEIGDKVFFIPKNHIWSRSDWKGGRVTGVNLHALLPDFQPLTAENRHEFDRLGWGQKISIMLSEHSMPPSSIPSGHVSMTRQEIYDRITQKQTAQEHDAPFGLRRQEFPKKLSGLAADELFVGTKPDGSFYWVKCRPDKKVPSPSCSTHIEYSKQVYMEYSFSKTHLSDWLSIEEGVFKLIHQFEHNTNQEAHK